MLPETHGSLFAARELPLRRPCWCGPDGAGSNAPPGRTATPCGSDIPGVEFTGRSPQTRRPGTAAGSLRCLCRGTRWVPGWRQEPMGPPACCRTPEGESLLCGPGAARTNIPPCRAATPCGSNMLGPRFRRFFSRGPTTRCALPLPRNPHGSLVGPGTHGSPCLLGTPRGGSPCLRPRRGENRLPAWQSRNTLWIETGRVPGPRRVPSVVERSHIVTFATALKVERFVPLKPSVPW